MSLAEEGRFTITWRVKNFSMCPSTLNCFIKSPDIRIKQFGNSEWKLLLYTNGFKTKDFVACFLKCKSLGISKAIKIEFALSVITESLDIIESKETENNYIKLDEVCGYNKFIAKENIFREKNKYLPQDTLTIKCSMKCKSEFKNLEEEAIMAFSGHSSSTNQFCCETTIRVQTKRFLWSIRGLETIPENKRITTLVFSSMKENPSFYLTLFKKVDEKSILNIEITRKDKPSKSTFVKCTVSAVNTPQCVNYCLEDEFLFASEGDVWTFSKSIDLNTLGKDGYFKLNEGVLYLQFDLAYAIDGQWHHIEKQDWKPFIPSVKTTVPTELFISPKSDDEDTVVSLRNGQQTFTVHKALLKSKSEVFRAMFENDMKEKETSVVDISDVDSQILGRMVNFLYTGTVGHLSVPDVENLYAAANKYQILSLTDHCSARLKSSLTVFNVCGLLNFADLYQDDRLLKTAEDFIFANSDRILLSQDWKDLMKNNLSLASDVMYKMLVK